MVIVTLAVLAGVAAIALRNYGAARNLFEADPPSPLLAAPASTGIPDLRQVSFNSPDGLKLSAWYAEPTNGAAIVVTHGTNSDRSTMLPEVGMLKSAGYGVLAFDWPGLGLSEGTVRWDSQARRALSAAFDWVAAQPGVDAHKLGGLGFSIGGFVLTQLAAQDPRVRAVVLEAVPPTFDDYLQVHNRRWGTLSLYPARWALRGTGLLDAQSAPLNLIHRISPRPILLLAGSGDQEIPARLVQKLYSAAREPKTIWIVQSDDRHGGYAHLAPIEYPQRVTRFFAEAFSQPPPVESSPGASPELSSKPSPDPSSRLSSER